MANDAQATCIMYMIDSNTIKYAGIGPILIQIRELMQPYKLYSSTTHIPTVDV